MGNSRTVPGHGSPRLTVSYDQKHRVYAYVPRFWTGRKPPLHRRCRGWGTPKTTDAPKSGPPLRWEDQMGAASFVTSWAEGSWAALRRHPSQTRLLPRSKQPDWSLKTGIGSGPDLFIGFGSVASGWEGNWASQIPKRNKSPHRGRSTTGRLVAGQRASAVSPVFHW